SLAGEDVFRRAGLLLTDGKSFVRLLRVAHRDAPGRGFFRVDGYHLSLEVNDEAKGDGTQWAAGHDPTGQAFLRIERRGDRLTYLVSQDGQKWTEPFLWSIRFPDTVTMPRRVKVGVVVEATAPGAFKAEFDRFGLSPPPTRTLWEELELRGY